MDGQY